MSLVETSVIESASTTAFCPADEFSEFDLDKNVYDEYKILDISQYPSFDQLLTKKVEHKQMKEQAIAKIYAMRECQYKLCDQRDYVRKDIFVAETDEEKAQKKPFQEKIDTLEAKIAFTADYYNSFELVLQEIDKKLREVCPNCGIKEENAWIICCQQNPNVQMTKRINYFGDTETYYSCKCCELTVKCKCMDCYYGTGTFGTYLNAQTEYIKLKEQSDALVQLISQTDTFIEERLAHETQHKKNDELHELYQKMIEHGKIMKKFCKHNKKSYLDKVGICSTCGQFEF